MKGIMKKLQPFESKVGLRLIGRQEVKLSLGGPPPGTPTSSPHHHRGAVIPFGNARLPKSLLQMAQDTVKSVSTTVG